MVHKSNINVSKISIDGQVLNFMYLDYPDLLKDKIEELMIISRLSGLSYHTFKSKNAFYVRFGNHISIEFYLEGYHGDFVKSISFNYYYNGEYYNEYYDVVNYEDFLGELERIVTLL